MTNSALQNNVSHNKFTKLSNNERLNFIPSITKLFIQFENYVFRLAEELFVGYKGGCWDFYSVDCNGSTLRIMVPPCNSIADSVNLKSMGFGRDIPTTAFTAGIAITMMALNHFACSERIDYNERVHLNDQYEKLYEYANVHLRETMRKDIMMFLD